MGWLLLAALACLCLDVLGVPAPFGSLYRPVLAGYAIWGVWRLGRRLTRGFLYKIRTKLIFSYLFIAFVPVLLLTIFFLVEGIVVLEVVGAQVVNNEIDHVAIQLGAVAETALAQRPWATGPGSADRLLAAASRVHPRATYTLIDRGRVVGSNGTSMTKLPTWWQTKVTRFGGLIKEEDGKELKVRAIAVDGASFVAIDAPVDPAMFAAIGPKMGLVPLSLDSESKASVSAEAAGGGLRIDLSDDEGKSDSAPGKRLAGFPIIVTPDRTEWDSGKVVIQPLVFEMHPGAFVRYLSAKGFRTPDVITIVLAVSGIVFVTMYAIALAIGFLLARSITKSVYALSRGTERLRNGDFTTPIRVTSRDQLGDLAESFNLMSAGIQDLLREQAEKERLEEELRIARQIQMSLLPRQGAVTLPGVRIAALCLPAAEVGGDYYDLLPLSPERMGVLVADVSGKGTSAALYMAELKGLVLSLSRIHESPARLLSEANRILAGTLDSRSFVTMTYAIIDATTRQLRYARAGHNPILHFERRTGRTRVLMAGGLGLGIDRGEQFDRFIEEQTVPFEAGDVFLFFTDGLSEAMNENAELYGEQRLRDILDGARGDALSEDALKDRILEDIHAFVGGAAQHDDMTMVVIQAV